MKIISHRCNTNGRNKQEENNPEKLLYLLKKDIDVEIDLWLIDNIFYLGHDLPQFEIDEKILHNNKNKI